MLEGGPRHSNSDIFNGNEFVDSQLKFEDDETIKERCKRALIRKSTREHDGHPYLETAGQIDGMDIKEVRKILAKIENDNIAS